jgi:hypothetical protein
LKFEGHFRASYRVRAPSDLRIAGELRKGGAEMRWWIVHRPLPNHPLGHDNPQYFQITGPLDSLDLAINETKGILAIGCRVTGIHDGENKLVMNEIEITKELGSPAQISN